MLQPGDVLDLTPLGGKFIIRKTGQETSGQSFDMEMVLNPQSGGPPVHTHPNATETRLLEIAARAEGAPGASDEQGSNAR